MEILKRLIKVDDIKDISISGLTNQLIPFCVNEIYEKNKKDILILTNSLYEANIYYSSLSKLNDNVYLFPQT